MQEIIDKEVIKFFLSYHPCDGLVTKLCPTLATPWTVSCQAPLSMRIPRQEQWNGLPFPFPRYLPTPGIEPESPAWQADSLLLHYLGSPYLVA